MRKGTIRDVSFQRMAVLARFFYVSLEYFRREGPPVETMADDVRAVFISDEPEEAARLRVDFERQVPGVPLVVVVPLVDSRGITLARAS